MALGLILDNYEVDEGAFNLRNMMQGVLERVVAIYESYGVPLPARQYWTMGNPATDCEQLVVAFIQMYLGAPGDEASRPQRCNQLRSAVLSIGITRGIPVVNASGRAPDAAKIQNYSEVSAVDAWVLMESINQLDQWDDTGFGPGVIATLSSMEPQGGFQTINLQVTIAVP